MGMSVKGGGGCGSNKLRLCPAAKAAKKSNPCAKVQGGFVHVARMHKSKICYNKAAYAKGGSGPCGSWCTLDIKVGSGCGSNAGRMCKLPAAKKVVKKIVKKVVLKKVVKKQKKAVKKAVKKTKAL